MAWQRWQALRARCQCSGGSTKLTAQFVLSEQFSLKPGGTYYFDLSAMGIPGTVNDALPDITPCTMFPLPTPGQWTRYKLTTAMETTEDYA